MEATPDEKEATEQVKEATEETKVDSGKGTTSTAMIPGSASVTVTSEGSSYKKPTPADHEERSVDPPPPG